MTRDDRGGLGVRYRLEAGASFAARCVDVIVGLDLNHAHPKRLGQLATVGFLAGYGQVFSRTVEAPPREYDAIRGN